jgi:hypothetical protein
VYSRSAWSLSSREPSFRAAELDEEVDSRLVLIGGGASKIARGSATSVPLRAFHPHKPNNHL